MRESGSIDFPSCTFPAHLHLHTFLLQNPPISSHLFMMRRGVLIFLVVNLIILSFLVRSVFTLLSLLVEDASADAIHRAELPSPNSSLIEQRPQVIPKIIHQTYKNESIPEVWIDAQRSCIDLHPDYEYIVS